VKAVVVHGADLAWDEVPTPVPEAGEVRVRVAAAGVNRADLVQRMGLYPPPPGASPILGLEVAGTVDAVGAEVDPALVGQACCTLLEGGGYAEFAVCPAEYLLPLPAGLSMEQAAGLPEVFATAFLNLFSPTSRLLGNRVLLHAGASGVGTAAIQLVKHFGGRCFVTVGSEEKVAFCVSLGADGGVNRHDGPWLQAVREWAPAGVDVVLDPVGASYLDDNQRCLGLDGRLVLIGLMGGRKGPLDLGRLLMKRQQLVGSTLRSRPVAFKIGLMARLREDIWPLFGTGALRPILDEVFPMARVADAHAKLASNHTVGKLVLSLK
jgi:putative PIG3 family NAD(P)H quinone oxidoreductase